MGDLSVEQKAEVLDRLIEMLRGRIKEAESICGQGMAAADFRRSFGKAAYDAMVQECNAAELATLDEVMLEMVLGLTLEMTGHEGDYTPEW